MLDKYFSCILSSPFIKDNFLFFVFLFVSLSFGKSASFFLLISVLWTVCPWFYKNTPRNFTFLPLLYDNKKLFWKQSYCTTILATNVKQNERFIWGVLNMKNKESKRDKFKCPGCQWTQKLKAIDSSINSTAIFLLLFLLLITIFHSWWSVDHVFVLYARKVSMQGVEHWKPGPLKSFFHSLLLLYFSWCKGRCAQD